MSEPKDKDDCQNSTNQPTVSVDEKTTESKDICDRTEEEKTDSEKVCTTVDSDDKSEQSPTKSILANGNATIPKRNLKKSVSFEPGDETIKKFTEGEVIVDKQNPFKNGALTGAATEKSFVIKPRRDSKNKLQVEVNDNEFVSTEDVLRESKYVTTYIKKPDKYFKYDPTIIARLKLEELKDTQVPKPVRKINLSRQTHERLKELKNKYSPAPLYAQSKVSKTKSADNTIVESKIPKYKRVSKSNYPDLSQLKVKTGTDIDESFFSPEEVAINAKRFDDRVKILHIGSEDELDDIEEPLTNNRDYETTTDQVDSNQKEEPKKSFTNTVNSKEFQEYLNKKGLTLTPKEKVANGKVPVTQEKVNGRARPVNNSTASFISPTNMDSKREKKGSVFQRLLHTGLFSSKRKTTPKGPVPTPQNLYNKPNDDIRPPSNMKRVVLERQSFHGGSSNVSTMSDIRKQLEQSRKSYGGEDRDSSISSALTNAEDFNDDHSIDSILELSNAYNESRSANRITDKQNKIRSSASLNRDRNKDPQSRNLFKSGDVRDSVVKPHAQRANITPKPSDRSEKPVPAIRRSLERQSLVSRKPPLPVNDDGVFFSRSASMDRHDIAKRTKKPNVAIQKPIRNGIINQKSASMPRNLKENYVSRDTSTPIPDKESIKPVNRINRIELSPIPSNQVLPNNLNTNPAPAGKQNNLSSSNINLNSMQWAKLREMKERTDEFYVRSMASQNPRSDSENIYERLPISQAQPQTRLSYSAASQPHYTSQLAVNPNFLRGSPQRNTYNGGYGGQNFIPVRPKHALPVEASVQVSPQPQPPRSQSVLDDMLVPQAAYGSLAGTPVIMRRKQNPTLTKEEILNRVRDFCRKSMNKTPTKIEGNTNKLQSDISPVSYASVDYQGRNIPKIVAPQVPQRVHSLQYSESSPLTPSASPIYAHVMKRGSIQSNVSDLYYSPTRKTQSLNRPRLPTTASDTSSVFLPGNQQPSSPDPIIIMDSDKVTPAHVMKFRKRSGSEVYGQVYPNNSYRQIPTNQQQQLQPTNSLCSRAHLDGRSTPLILMDPRPSPIYWNTPSQQPQPQQHPGIVYVRVKDQVYGPINTNRLQPPQYSPRKAFPYESESGSEAGEVQRILQSRGLEEDWQNDKSGRNQSSEQVPDDRRRAARREDPRRHTLGGDMLQYGGQGQPQQRAMDLEVIYPSYASLV